MTTLILALLCGAAIGVMLGGLGGGGSVLAVPALVYVLGETPREATTASLVVVGLTSAISMLNHHRHGNVRWRVGLVFAVVGIVFSYLGTALNGSVSDGALLVSFAALLLVSAAAMLGRGVRDRRAHQQSLVLEGAGGPPADVPSASGEAALRPGDDGDDGDDEPETEGGNHALLVIGSAAVVGFLTGFLGVGGGFIAVPALVLALRMPMAIAAGTSLLIISLNSATSLVMRLQQGIDIELGHVVPFTIGAIAATFLGHRIARRLHGHTLTIAFATVLVVVALGVAIEVALSS